MGEEVVRSLSYTSYCMGAHHDGVKDELDENPRAISAKKRNEGRLGDILYSVSLPSADIATELRNSFSQQEKFILRCK